MGIISKPDWDTIEIVQGVQGMIVVGGYTVMAKEQIEKLSASYPHLKILSFEYRIA